MFLPRNTTVPICDAAFLKPIQSSGVNIYHRTVSWHSSVMRTPIALPPISNRQGISAMTLRRPTLHLFRDRIAEEKKRLEAKIAELQPGHERDRLLRKLRQLDTAPNIDEWLNSSELQSPR